MKMAGPFSLLCQAWCATWMCKSPGTHSVKNTRASARNDSRQGRRAAFGRGTRSAAQKFLWPLSCGWAGECRVGLDSASFFVARLARCLHYVWVGQAR